MGRKIENFLCLSSRLSHRAVLYEADFVESCVYRVSLAGTAGANVFLNIYDDGTVHSLWVTFSAIYFTNAFAGFNGPLHSAHV
jgi:hypothetical protein